jgi:hypothetical protein
MSLIYDSLWLLAVYRYHSRGLLFVCQKKNKFFFSINFLNLVCMVEYNFFSNIWNNPYNGFTYNLSNDIAFSYGCNFYSNYFY